MVRDRLSLEGLFDHGWELNNQTGVEMPGFASVSLCLMYDGHRVVCIPGYGETKAKALTDVVEGANAWIVRQAAE